MSESAMIKKGAALPWLKPSSVSAVIQQESADVYHGKRARYMSSHQLQDFMRCPQLWYRKSHGFIKDKDNDAYALGRATHTFICEGPTEFEKQYIMSDGPVNDRTGNPYGKATQIYAGWLSEQTKPIISGSDYALILSMNKGVATNPSTAEVFLRGVAEGVVRTQYCGIDCQIRMDYYVEDHEEIVDFKTCKNLDYFESDARHFMYGNQIAFYRSVAMAGGLPVRSVKFVAVEKQEPYRAGLWIVDESSLEIWAQENAAAMERYRQCVTDNDWPTGYEDPRTLTI